MPLIQLELFSDKDLQSCFGKTFPGFSAPKTTLSDASWLSSLDQTFPFRPPQVDGRAQVLLPDPKDKLRGECSTLNISECPNDAVESSLSLVLERISPPQILFECQGVRGNSAQSGNERKDLAAFAEGSFGTFRRTPPPCNFESKRRVPWRRVGKPRLL